MRVIVKRADVAVRSGTGDQGRPWSIREQQAFAATVDKEGRPDDFPSKITIRLDEGQAPYAPGEYEVDERSFYVAQYGRLSLGNVVLRPMSAKSVVRSA